MQFLALIFIYLLPAVGLADTLNFRVETKVRLYRISGHSLDYQSPESIGPGTEMTVDILKEYTGTPNEQIRKWTNDAPATPNEISTTEPRRVRDLVYLPIKYLNQTYLAQIPAVEFDRGNFKAYRPGSKTEATLTGPAALDPAKNCALCRPTQDRSVQTGVQQQNTKSVEDILAESQGQKVEAAKTQANERHLPLASDYNASCNSFIKPDGTLGENGKSIVRELDRKEYAGFFYDNPQFSVDCPNYSSFSTTKKQDYIIHFLAHLAWIESTCGEKPNGPSGETGLFQLEDDGRIKSKRKNLAQPAVPEITDACEPPIANNNNNIRCTLFNFAAQLRGRFTVTNWNGGRGAKPQPLLTTASSWGPVINAKTRRKVSDTTAEQQTGAYATMYNQTRGFPGCGGSVIPVHTAAQKPKHSGSKSKGRKR